MNEFETDVNDCMIQYHTTGNGIFLLEAIRRCAQYGIAIPKLTREALQNALDRYMGAEVRTLDEAFNVSRQKSWNQSSAQAKLKKINGVSKAYSIYMRVLQESDQGTSIDMELFDQVGDEFSVSGSTARKYYNEVKKEMQDSA